MPISKVQFCTLFHVLWNEQGRISLTVSNIDCSSRYAEAFRFPTIDPQNEKLQVIISSRKLTSSQKSVLLYKIKMQDFTDASSCCKCRPMTAGSCAASEVLNRSSESGEKFYQEISTEMIGNALIIRVEKDPKRKLRKMRGSWEPPCDCDMVEIRRPTKGEGAKIVNGGDSNQVLFKVHSKSRIGKEGQGGYKPQAIAYKVGACGGGSESNDQCRTITVYPQMGGPGSQEVHSDHITEGNQDVFLLRINKKPDGVDPKQRNIELELRTPRPPTPKPDAEVKVEDPPPPAEPEEKAKKISKEKGKKGKGKKKK